MCAAMLALEVHFVSTPARLRAGSLIASQMNMCFGQAVHMGDIRPGTAHHRHTMRMR